jgi:GDPmannose 4,6-dehydratase
MASFDCLGLDWEKYVKIDPRFIRPAEVDLLIGDSSKARNVLGWQPKVDFEGLVKIMVESDYNLLKKAGA